MPAVGSTPEDAPTYRRKELNAKHNQYSGLFPDFYNNPVPYQNGKGSQNYWRPMIHKPPPFKGLNIRIPSITPIKRTGFINQVSTLRCIWGMTGTPKPLYTNLTGLGFRV